MKKPLQDHRGRFSSAFFYCNDMSARYYLLAFSQLWLPTVQEVLHADWQEVWHSPHPPFFMDSFKVLLFKVFTCFMILASCYIEIFLKNYITSLSSVQVKVRA